MSDLEAFREQVKSEAEDAVNEQLGRAASASDESDDDDGGAVLSSSEIASRGWELSDYNSFFGDCREDGYNASDCGSMWTAAKEAGLVDTGSVEAADNSADDAEPEPEWNTAAGDERDLLVIKERADSSDLTAQYLADPIMDGDIDVIPVESEAGQEILGALEDVPAVPAHLVVEGEEVRVGDLESLFQTYAGPA